MRSLAERPFHLLMATLIVLSLLVEQEAGRVLPAWNMPKVSLLTFALGCAWVALFAGYRIRMLQQRMEVLEDRLDRTSRLTEALEDDQRRRRSLPR